MADIRDYASDEESFDDGPIDNTPKAITKEPVARTRKNAKETVSAFMRTNWDGVLAEEMLRASARRTRRLDIAQMGHCKADDSPDLDGWGQYDRFIFCDVLPSTKGYEYLRKCVAKGGHVHVFTRSLHIARQVEDLEWITLKYAVDKMSSELLWEWLCEAGHTDNAHLPRCTPYIHDMTVWDWKHAPDSLYFSANIQSEKLSAKYLATLEGYSDAEFKRWLEKGEIIKKYSEHIIEQFARNPVTRYVVYENRTYKVLMIESRQFINEIANFLLDRHQVHIAAIYHYDMDAKYWRVSLRTAPGDSVDVSAIAKEYGGGGGNSAAAFKYFEDIGGLFIDKKDIHKVMKELKQDVNDPDFGDKQRANFRQDHDEDVDRAIRSGSIVLV